MAEQEEGAPDAPQPPPLSEAVPAVIASYSWNNFRYIGDFLHLTGVLLLLLILARNQSVKGFSRSTQILYLCVFLSRYLDLLDHAQSTYLVTFKLTYITTAAVIVYLFRRWDSTYERAKDTCSLVMIFGPCFSAALVLSNEYSVLEVLWTFSEFLEAFAMVPQYIFCYRDGGVADVGVTAYVMAIGGYRVFYAANWIYKKSQMAGYVDYQSWIGGGIEILFFLDFLMYRFMGLSLLRSMVLNVDGKISQVGDKMAEMTVLGPGRGTKAGLTPADESECQRLLGGGDEELQLGV